MLKKKKKPLNASAPNASEAICSPFPYSHAQEKGLYVAYLCILLGTAAFRQNGLFKWEHIVEGTWTVVDKTTLGLTKSLKSSGTFDK